jgi:hypothetical protein
LGSLRHVCQGYSGLPEVVLHLRRLHRRMSYDAGERMGFDACSYPEEQGWVRQGVIDWGRLSQITTYFESRRGWKSSRLVSPGPNRRETGWAGGMRCRRSCPSSCRACCPPCPCREYAIAVLAVRTSDMRHQHWLSAGGGEDGRALGRESDWTYHALPEAFHHV